jgi:hypothetical protein
LLYVDLEVTEVQRHFYYIMEGWLNSGGQLASLPAWNLSGWMVGDGVPFATRAPWMMPLLDGQEITFTQRDPITGIVKLGVPAYSYSGLDHSWYSTDVGTWFNAKIVMETQGCGWLFTGIGKNPILGSVDYMTYNNYSGVYSFGLDGVAKTQDDELLAGEAFVNASAGAGPPLGPCLQNLRGYDDIPCTPDDPLGRADPDGPNPPGSSILYLPTTMIATFWTGASWAPLFVAPWPQLLTTGTAYDEVIEPLSGIDGQFAIQTGEPWEFFAGIQGPHVGWKDPKCNVFVKYACAWSVLHTTTDMGNLDVLFEVWEKKVREDELIADINCDETCNIIDIVICALGFGSQDEYIGPDGIPGTGDDKPVADPAYDARGDIRPTRGKIDIVDIVKIALDFGKNLDP